MMKTEQDLTFNENKQGCENKQKFTLLKDETTTVNGKTLYRIKYLMDIPDTNVKAGTIGGWLESENNLSQEGRCCVLDNAVVMDNAVVKGEFVTVSGIATINGNAIVEGYATTIKDSAHISDNAKVVDSICKHTSCVCGDSEVINSMCQEGAFIAGKTFIKNCVITGYVKNVKMIKVAPPRHIQERCVNIK